MISKENITKFEVLMPHINVKPSIFSLILLLPMLVVGHTLLPTDPFGPIVGRLILPQDSVLRTRSHKGIKEIHKKGNALGNGNKITNDNRKSSGNIKKNLSQISLLPPGARC